MCFEHFGIRILMFMYVCMKSNLEMMGMEEGGMMKENEMGNVSKFLNRLLGLKLMNQNMVSLQLSVIVNLNHVHACR